MPHWPLADLGEDLGGAASRVQAGDAVDDLLGQVRAGDVVGVAADPVHLVRVREVDSGGIGDQIDRRMIRPWLQSRSA